MMGLGFGSLKQMSDTFKYNRSLLGKKNSIREIYKDEIKKLRTTEDNQNIDFVRLRVRNALKRSHIQELLTRLTAILILIVLMSGIIWAVISFASSSTKHEKYENKSALFKTIIYEHSKDLKLKADYFPSGPKAAETFLKHGLKHQTSESYYESGEQFRSALYYYDSLVTDIYFYKTGDTIKDFSARYDQKAYRIRLAEERSGKQIEFDFYDGKIIQGTYIEKMPEKTTH